jgi:hypothetical protein
MSQPWRCQAVAPAYILERDTQAILSQRYASNIEAILWRCRTRSGLDTPKLEPLESLYSDDFLLTHQIERCRVSSASYSARVHKPALYNASMTMMMR